MNQKEFSYFIFSAASQLLEATKHLRHSQDFSLNGLKRLHDMAFKSEPDLPNEVQNMMNSYYVERPFVETWSKMRTDVTPYPYLTIYSPLEKSDMLNAEQAIMAARPENMSKLTTDEKLARLATVYAEIDYLHRFGDGNSRVNRIFVKELAQASGIHLSWDKTTTKQMYAARDKSLAKLNLSRRAKQLKKIAYYMGTVYQALEYTIEDLQEYYPNTFLYTLIKGIATEIT